MYERLDSIAYYNKFYFHDSFRAQCVSLDELCMEQFRRSEEALRSISSDSIFRSCDHIIFCGCGDSYVAAKAARAGFEHYLLSVRFEAVEGIELSRHYDFSKAGKNCLAVFISYSGTSLRTLEAMQQCRRHGVLTMAVTVKPEAPLAKEADIVYLTNNPLGDNNAGLRTYFSNVLSCTMLAAAMADERDGGARLKELGTAVDEYRQAVDKEFAGFDDDAFRCALKSIDTEFIEIASDPFLESCADFIQAKVAELSGDPCESLDGPGLAFLCRYRKDPEKITTIIISAEGRDSAELDAAAEAAKSSGRTVHFLMAPEPPEGFAFLAQLYAWLPAALFAGFRHTTIGEPMFRGGFDPDIFIPTYFSPVEITG
ncbi:MAG: SIS domain-containing protein [Firmicutes bacterium]|nr:SIS domain-containing protein [Bacillota bacterium]